MTSSPTGNYLHAVRAQYEDYPYPKRDPDDEKKRLYAPFCDSLDLINYYGFEGKQTFSEHFRVLIAGGGTGDATIYLAEQLRHTNAEIVYVDISRASMAIAKQRAKMRGLTNITWIHDSLLSLPGLNLEPFDYINCSGVLHHLANPSAGLTALANVLKPDGIMMIMVYATYGRTGIYPIQQLMHLLTKQVTDQQEKVDLFKRVFKQLPATNWFQLCYEQFCHEVETFGDIGIYDLFLHSQDRSYTILELYEWVQENQLQLQHLLAQNGMAKTLYNPLSFIKHPDLRKKIALLSAEKQQAIAEILAGDIITHTCVLSKRCKSTPSPEQLDYVPIFATTYVEPGSYPALYHLLASQNPANQGGKFYLVNSEGTATSITAARYTLELFKFIDGKRTIEGIIQEVIKACGLMANEETKQQLHDEFITLFHEANFYDWLLLRHPSVPPFKSLGELQAPITARYAKQTLYKKKS